MALRRYRHFWGSSLEASAVGTARTVGDPMVAGSAGQSVGDLEVGDDLTSIIKAYNPPEFARSVRQVEVGKVMNERILGRLDPEATNFSVVMTSDFELFYGYNHDYRFRIVEELHNNHNATIRYATDVVTGTLFRREWGDYRHNDQDRDVTLHFLLRAYQRTFSDNEDGTGRQWMTIDVNMRTQTFRHAGRVTLPNAAGTGTSDFTLPASLPESPTFFGPARPIPEPAPVTPPPSPFSPMTN